MQIDPQWIGCNGYLETASDNVTFDRSDAERQPHQAVHDRQFRQAVGRLQGRDEGQADGAEVIS
jgi:hypothetical protein